MSITKVLYKESKSAYHGQIFLADFGYDNTLSKRARSLITHCFLKQNETVL